MRPVQRQMVDQVVPYTCKFLMAGMGAGKGLTTNTMIPTELGWRRMGDLKDGDVVFDERGQPCNIVKAHDPYMPTHKFEFELDTGEVLESCPDHLWAIRTHKQRSVRSRQLRGFPKARKEGTKTGDVLNSQQVYEKFQTQLYAMSIDVLTGPVLYPEQDLLVDPYLLGVWLAEGRHDAGVLHLNRGDADHILGRIDRNHSRAEDPRVRCDRIGLPGLLGDLRTLGVLRNKHIPDQYLKGSVSQRLALLQGLMDTDGGVGLRAPATEARRSRGDAYVRGETGGAEFYASNEVLARQVRELVCSLGFKANIRGKQAKLYGVDKKYTYSVSWTASRDQGVFSLPRKAALLPETLGAARPSQYRFITDVRRVDPVEMRCLTVDSPSRLFLCTESYIPTHNTASVIQSFIEARALGYATHLWVVTKPTVAKTTWPSEVLEWADFEHLRVSLVHGPHKYDRLMSPADIYVTTFHGLGWILRQCPDPAQRMKFLPGWGQMMAVDESAAIKNPKSNAFAAVWMASQQNEWRYRIPMNATPSVQDRIHVWGQYAWMDGGELLGRPTISNKGKITGADEFNARFCEGKHNGHGMKYSMSDDQWFPLLDRLSPYTYCVRTKDVAQLPQFDLNIDWLQLDQRSQDVHDKIRNKLGVELDELGITLEQAAQDVSVLVEAQVFDEGADAEEKVLTSSGGVWYNYCSQACSGNIYLNEGGNSAALVESLREILPDIDGRHVYQLHYAKVNALLQLLYTPGKLPALVSYKYKHEHALYCGMLKKYNVPFETLTSRTPAAKAQDIIRRFRNGQLHVLLGHPAALGHGLNLQGRCNTAIFTSPLDSADQFMQFICRVYRPGIKVDKFSCHVLCAEDSLEQELVLPRMLKRREDFDKTEDYLIARQVERLGPIPGSLANN